MIGDRRIRERGAQRSGGAKEAGRLRGPVRVSLSRGAFGVAFVGSLLLVGCSKEESTASSGGALVEKVEQAAARAEGGTDAPDANSCLLGYATKYDELVPVALAAEVLGRDAAQAKTNYSKVMKDSRYHEIVHAWSGTRQHEVKVGTMTVKTPKDDVVALSGMHATTRQRFELDYQVPSATAKEEVEKLVEESKDPGLDTKEKKELGKGLGGMLVDIAKANRKVSGAGESAVWNDKTMELQVFERGVGFTVRVDATDDAPANLDKALALAKKVLARCR